jgi:hypothetical protein
MADECCGSAAPDSPDTDDGEFTAAIEQLTEHENRILKEVATPQATQDFLRDPRETLHRLKIPIPAVVDHRLRLPNANRIEDVTAKPVTLPNGQTLTPRVKVRIVGRKH